MLKEFIYANKHEFTMNTAKIKSNNNIDYIAGLLSWIQGGKYSVEDKDQITLLNAIEAFEVKVFPLSIDDDVIVSMMSPYFFSAISY